MHPRALKAYNLACDPFSKEIEDNELWLPPGKKSLVQAIVDGIRQRRHILLTGEPGAGKTVVLRAVRRTLSQTKFRLTYCHNATLGRRDFYRQLCRAIGLSTKATAAAVFNALNEYVEQLAADQKAHPVFLLDESHLLKDEMLDHLHILQNYGWDSRALLSLVLIGLPELNERLHRRRHRSLMSRIDYRLTLEPLTPTDTGDYVEHRLKLAGNGRELFPPDAVALLHEKTGGLMRDIDRLGTLALELGARAKVKVIHKDIVLDAISIDMHGGLTC